MSAKALIILLGLFLMLIGKVLSKRYETAGNLVFGIGFLIALFGIFFVSDD